MGGWDIRSRSWTCLPTVAGRQRAGGGRGRGRDRRADDARLRQETSSRDDVCAVDRYRWCRLPKPDLGPARGAPLRRASLARDRCCRRALARPRRASLVQETPSGLQPIEVRTEDGLARGHGAERAGVRRGARARRGDDRGRVARPDAHPELPPQVVSTGLPHLMAPIADAEALAGALPDYSAIHELIEPHDALILYLAWCEPTRGTARARGSPGPSRWARTRPPDRRRVRSGRISPRERDASGSWSGRVRRWGARACSRSRCSRAVHGWEAAWFP